MQNIYKIELEICEARNCRSHHAGEIFLYPQDCSRVCPWLLDSARSMIRVLQYGGRLPWEYAGTPYEKLMDPQGVTTEYIRCPDPTAHVILKIIRTKIGVVGSEGNSEMEQKT